MHKKLKLLTSILTFAANISGLQGAQVCSARRLEKMCGHINPTISASTHACAAAVSNQSHVISLDNNPMMRAVFTIWTTTDPQEKLAAQNFLKSEHERISLLVEKEQLSAPKKVPIHEKEAATEWEKFVEKHKLPRTLQEQCDHYKDVLAKINYGCTSLIPGIMIKGTNVSRVFNAYRMQECIRKHNLDKVASATKYIFINDGIGQVVAEYIDGEALGTLTLDEVQQMTVLAQELGFYDWGTNFLRNRKNGKITCIDTEDNSFTTSKTSAIAGLSHLAMTSQARTWLKDRYDAFANMPAQAVTIANTFNTFYDPAIDVRKVMHYSRKLETAAVEKREAIRAARTPEQIAQEEQEEKEKAAQFASDLAKTAEEMSKTMNPKDARLAKVIAQSARSAARDSTSNTSRPSWLARMFGRR